MEKFWQNYRGDWIENIAMPRSWRIRKVARSVFQEVEDTLCRLKAFLRRPSRYYHMLSIHFIHNFRPSLPRWNGPLFPSAHSLFLPFCGCYSFTLKLREEKLRFSFIFYIRCTSVPIYFSFHDYWTIEPLKIQSVPFVTITSKSSRYSAKKKNVSSKIYFRFETETIIWFESLFFF